MNYLVFYVIIISHSATRLESASLVDRVKNREKLITSLVRNCNYLRVDQFVGYGEGPVPYHKYTYALDTLVNSHASNEFTTVELYMQGNCESRILLSPTKTYEIRKSPVYEFRFDYECSGKSDMRRQVQGHHLLNSTYKLMDPFEPVKVTIQVSKSGHVKVFKNDEAKPFLSGHDRSPTPVKYISFGSLSNVIEYYFNCTEQSDEKSNDLPAKIDTDSQLYFAVYLKGKQIGNFTWQ